MHILDKMGLNMNTNDMSIKKATLINALGKYSTIIIQLLVNAVLSRILTPGDYGIVAIITVFSTFFLTLSDMGFSTAIVQQKELNKEEVDNIYAFTFWVALILVGLFTLISYIISIIYENDIFFKLGLLLNISLFLNTVNMVPNGLMNREKQFVSISFRTVVAATIAAIIAVIAAINGLRYYSIVIQTIISSIIVFVWNYLNTKPSLKFNGCLNSVRKVLNYTSFQFAFNIVNYFSRNLDNLLTGKFFGSVELGYYNKAYTLMLYPINNLAGVITPVIHPLLSDYRNDKKIIYEKYIKLEKLLFVLAIYIAPFCYLSSSELIRILFGNNWESSIRCFELLSLAILPQFVGSPIGAIYQSLGETKLLFCNSLLNTAITIVAIIFGILWGKNIYYLSLFVAIAYTIHFFTNNFILLIFGFKYSFVDFLKKITKELVFALIVFLVAMIYPFSFNNIWISVLMKGIYLFVIYAVIFVITKEYKVLNIISRKK